MSSAAGARSGCFCGALDMDDTEKRADPAVASMTEVADLDKKRNKKEAKEEEQAFWRETVLGVLYPRNGQILTYVI